MTDTEKTTSTYHARDDVSIEAERFSVKTPQVRSTVTNSRHHYLVRKDGSRTEIQVGDFIVRGDDGQGDSMPPALFRQIFEQDADKAAAQADAERAAGAERDAEVAAASAEESAAEAQVDAADAVDYGGAPVHGDDEPTADIFGGDDQPEDPPAESAKKAKKTSKRKKKA